MKNYNATQKPKPKTVEEGIKLLVDGFSGSTERDISTGDKVEIVILSRDGKTEKRSYPLRFD
jgi:20S proteasome alpha/beta subunit